MNTRNFATAEFIGYFFRKIFAKLFTNYFFYDILIKIEIRKRCRYFEIF